MRIGLSLSFFLITVLVYSQGLAVEVQDSLPAATSLGIAVQDSLITLAPPAEKKTDSLILSYKQKQKEKAKTKKPEKKRYVPHIKSMDEVTISDYKILYLDETEKSVDTSLSIEGEYSFNFLRTDYFEYLPLPNMGEGFNKMGYDFH